RAGRAERADHLRVHAGGTGAGQGDPFRHPRDGRGGAAGRSRGRAGPRRAGGRGLGRRAPGDDGRAEPDGGVPPAGAGRVTRGAWTVARKEMRETLRDWRTLLMMVGVPVLLYPALLVLSQQLALLGIRRVESQ